jgi:lipid-A-disaccharide synthase
LYEQGKITKALVAGVAHIDETVYHSYLKEKSWCILTMMPMEQFYNQLDAALVASGTATLETAYFRVPMVIVYRVHALTWYLARIVVKLKQIGLANIVAGTQIASELLQDAFKADAAAAALSSLLNTNNNINIRDKMKIVYDKLGPPGASAETARLIKEFLES